MKLNLSQARVQEASFWTWIASMAFAVLGFFFVHDTIAYRIINVGWIVSTISALILMLYLNLGKFNR